MEAIIGTLDSKMETEITKVTIQITRVITRIIGDTIKITKVIIQITRVIIRIIGGTIRITKVTTRITKVIIKIIKVIIKIISYGIKIMGITKTITKMVLGTMELGGSKVMVIIRLKGCNRGVIMEIYPLCSVIIAVNQVTSIKYVGQGYLQKIKKEVFKIITRGSKVNHIRVRYTPIK
jgi:hypothetical protein